MTADRSARLQRPISQSILALTVPVTLVSRGVVAALLAGALASPLLSGAATAAAVGRTAAAAPAQGPLLAWGLNEVGQLGTGDKSHYDSPVRVNVPFGLRAIGARSGNSSVAVNASGRAYTWGSGQDGQLGNGAFDNHLRPVQVRLPRRVKLRAAREGFAFVVALTTTGKALTWGYGAQGQLGNGHRANRNAPVYVSVPRGVRVTAVSACGACGIALTSDGRVLAWGDNSVGQLGNGKTGSTDVPVWVKLPKHTKVTSIAAGDGQLFAVTSTGGLLAWGSDNEGQLGNRHTGGLSRVPVRVHLPRGVKIASVSSGMVQTLGLTTTGKVLAWGGNQSGQLGTGNKKNSNVPVYVHLPKIAHIVAIAAGRYHGLALTRGGKILGWGDDSFGQLGDGGPGTKLTPVAVSVPGRKVLAIGAGPEALDSMAVVDQIVD
jgi:alpha-tubulin suppressor-like RCC1 family protein